jgi:hypothetical protein
MRTITIPKAVMALVALALASSAFADGYVELTNNTEQRVCFGKSTYYVLDGGASGWITEGWTCVDPAASFRFEIGLNDYVYVSAIDDGNNDFLETRLVNYPAVQTWAPVDRVDFFGVDVEERPDGTYLYSHYLNDDDWASDQIVGARDALDTFLGDAGFHKITGRVFRGADYPGGLTVSINF